MFLNDIDRNRELYKYAFLMELIEVCPFFLYKWSRC